MSGRTLVTGGAGFLGCNLAQRLLGGGGEVTVFDDLSRPGSASNLAWLREHHAEPRLRLVEADIRDAGALEAAAADADCIFHLAGQVAVTSSVADPRADFEANALGTFNALEAARRSGRRPIFVYASTNKVYGDLEWAAIREEASRYRFAELPHGIAEHHPLAFHSPYGCSKGAGDQYVRDYSRIYGLPTVVLRQSCVYGPRQLGLEDQGWVAWFAIAALRGDPITVYGDGRQVRDLLYVDDLVDAWMAAVERIDEVRGEAFNIGGGNERSLSVWAEFGPLLERLTGRRPAVRHREWRPGDQRVYVSDTRRAQARLGWHPRVGVEEGLQGLLAWVEDALGQSLPG